MKLQPTAHAKAQTKLLEGIKENPEARNEIEAFIEENNTRASEDEKSKSPHSDLANKMFKDLKRFARDIKNRFDIEPEATMLYAFLDKKLMKKLSCVGQKIIDRFSITFESRSKAYTYAFTLNGSECERAYHHREEDVTNFLYVNVSLFPDSSQKYIKSKIKESDENPKLEKIKNPFEAKTLGSSMEKKFRQSQAKQFLSFFKKIEDIGDRISTLGYFHKIIGERYPEEKRACEFAKTLAEGIFESVEKRFDFGLEQKTRRQEWRKVRDMLKHVDEIRMYLIKNIYATTHDICFIMEPFATTEEEKQKILKLQWARTENKLNARDFCFKDCDEATQKILFEESKRQFFLNNPGYA